MTSFQDALGFVAEALRLRQQNGAGGRASSAALARLVRAAGTPPPVSVLEEPRAGAPFAVGAIEAGAQEGS
ncbi:MAG: hypothetical protein M3463_22895, partial [Verrucomicrobiota bacterium]|nr:hypothetical protein [Verrucomicrobiota bacterium]